MSACKRAHASCIWLYAEAVCILQVARLKSAGEKACWWPATYDATFSVAICHHYYVQVTTTFIRWHPADVIVCVLTWLTGKDSADTSSVTTSRWAPSETSTNSFPSESALEMQVSIVRKSADITFWELIGIKPHCRHLQHKCKKVILRFFLKFLSFVTFFLLLYSVNVFLN